MAEQSERVRGAVTDLEQATELFVAAAGTLNEISAAVEVDLTAELERAVRALARISEARSSLTWVEDWV